MAFDTMFGEMKRQLSQNGASQEQDLAYSAAFVKAADSAGSPLPCPLCFLSGKPSHLQSIPGERGNEGAVCDTCHTKFLWPQAN